MPPLPPITKYLLIINVAVFFLDDLLGGVLRGPLSAWFGLWPIGPNFMPWQVVTYAFLHGDFFHLLFNMFGLWTFGAELERLWGQPRFAQFYAASVLSAAATQLIVTSMAGRWFRRSARQAASSACCSVSACCSRTARSC